MTIVERVRCMLSHAKLPKSYWGEALMTAVYLINLSPSYPLQGDVPNRVWYNKHVSYDHLKVFGCKAFVHIPQDERLKLDAKTRQCIFFGYGLDEFGYKLFDPIAKKVVGSCDVVFVEDQTIEDIVKTKVQVPQQEPLVDLDPIPAALAPQQAGKLKVMLQMMHKMRCMVQVMKILPSSMSLMLKLMIQISRNQYQKIHQ